MGVERRPSSAKRPSSWLRRAAVLGLSAAGVVAVTSCDDADYGRYRDCDYVVRRCRTVCDYWCDRWGCYPMCFDQCWGDCVITPKPPPGATTPPSQGDASAPPPATDAGAPSADGGGGVLCSACSSNDDCAPGALCIFRGGPRPDASADGGAAAAAGFCGNACAVQADCPQGFTCTDIGASKQCLANNGVCE